MKIAIICGGISTERDVSIASAKLIYQALMSLGHTVILVDAYMGTTSKLDNLYAESMDLVPQSNLSTSKPDIQAIKNYRYEQMNGTLSKDEYFGANVINICKEADITFISMHGKEGENGMIQAYFDMQAIKYTGSGYEASMLAMDKSLTKAVLNNSDILNAKSIALTNVENINNHIEIIEKEIGYPCVVKPCTGGSSIGVNIARNYEDLYLALKEAFQLDKKILVEEYIKGVEVSVGVINGYALPPIEIVPNQDEFYDYLNKYQAGKVKEICPARLDRNIIDELQQRACDVYGALGIEIYGRVDFIVSANKCYCLEANTLPGMTPTSLLPQEAKALDISYEQLCDRIINLSMKKYE